MEVGLRIYYNISMKLAGDKRDIFNNVIAGGILIPDFDGVYPLFEKHRQKASVNFISHLNFDATGNALLDNIDTIVFNTNSACPL